MIQSTDCCEESLLNQVERMVKIFLSLQVSECRILILACFVEVQIAGYALFFILRDEYFKKLLVAVPYCVEWYNI
jgi:hypothetical protein